MSSRMRPFWFLRRRPDEIAADVHEELEVHLAMRVEELRARGVNEEDARREALRQFGDRDRAARYCREEDLLKQHQMRRHLALTDLLQDARICLRALRRAPTLTATIVLTVGLGIGATTAMFAAVHAVLLRPLPYRAPRQLVRIYTDAVTSRYNFSVADYLTLQREQTQFAQVAGYVDRPMTFSNGSTGELVHGRVVSWTYFDVLGLAPALGRAFGQTDSRLDSPPVAIVSHRFWRDRLGARSDAIGRAVRFDGADYLLVGVLPTAVGPLEARTDFFLAARWTEPRRKGPFFINTIGRIRPGVDPRVARSELQAINKRMFPVWRSSYQDERATWRFDDLKTFVAGDTQTSAGVAIAAVTLMWLIACANASGLLLARLASRRRELAVRVALGASRGRVARLLAAEGGLLALGAALIGLAATAIALAVFTQAGVSYLPRTDEIALDGPVLIVWAALTAASGLLFGLLPAMHGTGRMAHILRRSSRSATADISSRRGRRVLVAAQFAIATPLLAGAALLLVSLHRLERVDLGFDTQNVITAAIRLPSAEYQDRGRAEAMWSALADRVGRLPGVTAAAFTDSRPPDGAGSFNNFDLERHPTPPGQPQPVTPWIAVTPSYFRTLGLSLLEGRLFDERDARDSAPPVIVVDRAWAQRFFPAGTAVGKRLVSGGCTGCPLTTVVGVVSTAKYAGLDTPDDGTAYTPITETISRYVVVRTATDASAVIPTLQTALRELSPSLAVSSVATIDDLVVTSLQLPRSLSWLIGAFAAAALLLSSIGIYGVMANYVEQHAREMCIRLTLGSSPSAVGSRVVAQGMKVVIVGVLAGVAGALVATHTMASLLFGIDPANPVIMGGVSALLLAIAGVACVIPARRVLAMNPASVLRSE